MPNSKKKKATPKKDQRWSQPAVSKSPKGEKRFRKNKDHYQKLNQTPKQGGNMPRALGGHR